ncbi:hypothetical protein B7R21_07950 [Subtercola boreus]|uniref:Peptidoglycan binding-like domain-containing protein n=1 Tax=Subtercola boreus TaxID=120213 RepID=A0A3E0VTE9_9MICO|nr:peptidoglycan-binding domain-containing protein [Subtercola boreus]RFA13294.1 hypothetical protein B7R21_07950 [Subtercola boreus]
MNGRATRSGRPGHPGSRLRMTGLTVPGVVALVVGVALAAWASTVLLSPPGQAAEPGNFATATVTLGEVGSELSLNAAAEWQSAPVARNEAAGIVTSVDSAQGGDAQQGSRLYSVNGRAVIVARGEIPAYRALSEGDSGDDARQLQQLLSDTGFFTGEVDGVLGADARRAIERWQESLGVPASGEVALGDVVFVPSLPSRLTLDGAVTRGARLAGGEQVVLGLGSSPQFTVPFGPAQAAGVLTGARVELTAASGQQWQAVVAGRSAAATGSTVVITLAAPSDATTSDATPSAPAPICGASCGEIPVTGPTLLAARIITVESVHGPVVPSMALQSDAQQGLLLVDSAGTRHPVTVLASARGMSVVRGVDPGVVVRVPNAASGAGEPAGDGT